MNLHRFFLMLMFKIGVLHVLTVQTGKHLFICVIRLDVALTKNLTLFLQWLQHALVLVQDLKNFDNDVGSTSTVVSTSRSFILKIISIVSNNSYFIFSK